MSEHSVLPEQQEERDQSARDTKGHRKRAARNKAETQDEHNSSPDRPERGITGEDSGHPSPFRAKFRAGTPRRKSEPVTVQESTPSITSPSSSQRDSSLMPPLEIEVTGLRPVKRHARAFFGEKKDVVSDGTQVGGTPGGGLENELSESTFEASLVSSDTQSEETADQVPHFTDEEFDDWFEEPRYRGNPSVTQEHRGGKRQAFERTVGDIATRQRGFQEPRKQFFQAGAAELGRGGMSRGQTGRRASARPSGARSLDSARTEHVGRRSGSVRVSYDPHHSDASSQGRYTNNRGHNDSGAKTRNSASLVDTTALRLYGNSSGPARAANPRRGARGGSGVQGGVTVADSTGKWESSLPRGGFGRRTSEADSPSSQPGRNKKHLQKRDPNYLDFKKLCRYTESVVIAEDRLRL